MQTVRKKELKYRFDGSHKPVAQVKPGETFDIETEINVGRAITEDSNAIDQSQIQWPYVNPLTGPIWIEGAQPGDVLRIMIHDIVVEEPVYCAIMPGWSAFPTWFNREDFLPRTHRVSVKDGMIHWSDSVTFPAIPMLGTIGVAPTLEAPTSVDNGSYGGNMDVQETCIGNVLVLSCNIEGGQLYLGDVQARQGDGELACTSIECRSRTRLSVELQKKPISMRWPRIEGPDYYMTVVSLHPMEHAFLHSFEELLNWILEEYEIEFEEAYMLLGQTVEARASAIANRQPTYVSKIRHSFLEGFNKRQK